MKIEEQIKQSTFRDPFHKAMINLKYTHYWFCAGETKIFKKYGIQPQHFNVLRIVKGSRPKPISPGRIIEVMIDSGRDLTRLVDKLVKLGYLDRAICPSNRRQVDITITEEGLEITDKITEEVNEYLDSFGSLTADEAIQLSDLLDKLRSK